MRKTKPKKRILLPDPKYNDLLVARFINDLMKDGKKSVAYSVFYDTLDIVEKRIKDTELTPLEIWKTALETIPPAVEVKSPRVAVATIQLPMEIRHERKVAIRI